MVFSSCETEEDNQPNKPNIYLDSNGVTIKCEDCKVGDKGKVNGVEYEVVDNQLLRQRLEEGKDLSKVCTSLVTSTMDLFDGFPNFNKPVGNWDVSNVVNMSGTFYHRGIVSVPNTKFNQSIEYWDVSKVKDMSYMFYLNEFNQPIGNWNVSNVTDMNSMFSGSLFNQPISNWDVSNVTNMSYMFIESLFNQPIGNWNVSNVSNMDFMFSQGAKFNQNISKWCVTKITSEPQQFSSNLSPENKPKWGTCPNN
jgi:surface protein